MPVSNHQWEEGFISEGFKGFLYRGKGGNRAVVADGGEDKEKEACREAQRVCVCLPWSAASKASSYPSEDHHLSNAASD